MRHWTAQYPVNIGKQFLKQAVQVSRILAEGKGRVETWSFRPIKDNGGRQNVLQAYVRYPRLSHVLAISKHRDTLQMFHHRRNVRCRFQYDRISGTYRGWPRSRRDWMCGLVPHLGNISMTFKTGSEGREWYLSCRKSSHQKRFRSWCLLPWRLSRHDTWSVLWFDETQ